MATDPLETNPIQPEVRNTPQIMTPAQLLERTYFYNLYQRKDAGLPSNQEIQELLAEGGVNLIKPLVFPDPDTSKVIRPSVYLCETPETGPIKVRVCPSSEEALRIFDCVNIAVAQGLRTPPTIKLWGNCLALGFAPGHHEIDFDINEINNIGKMHAGFIVHYPELKDLMQIKMQDLLENCQSVIEESIPGTFHPNLYAQLYERMPKLLPVFDHHDIGKHNLIKNGDNFWIIDEEAFGIIPFGYAISRAIDGRKTYSICSTPAERKAYMQNFPPDLAEYAMKTHNYWTKFYRYRAVARSIVLGNVDLARRLARKLNVGNT